MEPRNCYLKMRVEGGVRNWFEVVKEGQMDREKKQKDTLISLEAPIHLSPHLICLLVSVAPTETPTYNNIECQCFKTGKCVKIILGSPPAL